MNKIDSLLSFTNKRIVFKNVLTVNKFGTLT